MQIVTRKFAVENGFTTYFTGKPCRRGHIAIRRTKAACCSVCATENLREYRKLNIEQCRARDRAWSAAHPERMKEKNKRRYENNREREKARTREWYRENKDYALRAAKEYRAKNIETLKPKERARAASYRARFPEKAKQFIDNWWAKNPGRKNAYGRNRHARKRGNGGSHSSADIVDIFRLQRGKCALCRIDLVKSTQHVDHIISLKAGGSNARQNLQLLCEPCNLLKGARDPIDHSRSLGMLL